RIERTQKIAKTGDAKAKKKLEVLEKCKAHLESGQNIRSLDLDKTEKEEVYDLFLLTGKPVIYVGNVEEESALNGNKYIDELKELVSKENAEVIVISAAIEAQIAEFEDEEERDVFLEEYGLKESGLHKLIRASYSLLNLITYFTAGETEVRAWTIHKGDKAPQAAGVIHSDFEKGFIKAEVIKIPDYQKYKTEFGCREAGKIAIEGKEYVVADGDVMHFRFNV
ncbi:MAG: YchF family ATPase, partial [Cyclobacteriaceae bacterium]|nr:YchF family ATPase [Cyclobacteriaceae bacterium]